MGTSDFNVEPEEISVRVSADVDSAVRLDRYLAEHEGVATRSALQNRLTSISCNGRSAKLSTKVNAGDEIRAVLAPPDPIGVVPEELPLSVIYEDENVLVINKDQGVVVHPGAGNRSGTIANALAWRYRYDPYFAAEDIRPGIVHRLDKETSGTMIVAKSPVIHDFLVKQFVSRTVEKRYLALLKNVPRTRAGTITGRIGRDPHNRVRYALVDSGGKAAETGYQVLRSFGTYALVRFSPRTGRTHQIRVHAQSIGCPILGDPLYARRDSHYPDASLMLHAAELVIATAPGDSPRRFWTPPPERFLSLIRELRHR